MKITAPDFGKVAVLMGGTSAEREVSLKSGKAVFDALRRKNVDAHAIDPASGYGSVAGGTSPGTNEMEQRKPRLSGPPGAAVDKHVLQLLEQGRYDRAFIVLHGRGGEDGVLQGALELLGLPYTGSGVLGSALSMDKLRSKQAWLGAGLPTPEFVIVNGNSDFSAVAKQLGLPLMIKPAHEGSSIGISKVTEPAQLQLAHAEAAKFDDCVIAERCIAGPEYTASILGEQVLPLIRLETPHTFYDYDAKYFADSTRYFCPAGLDAVQERTLQDIAWRAFVALNCKGWGRIDFMCDKDGRPWLIEANTVPGMTDHSLVPMAARAAGIDFDELVWRILASSLDHGKVKHA